MSESRLFKKLKRATPGFDWERHEDKFVSGIPDCSYGAKGVNGWVELKTYDSWPRNPEDPLKFSDLKPTQINWAYKRGKSGGHVWFLVSIDGCGDWFLISWIHSRRLGKLNREELLRRSDLHGNGPIDKSIVQVFTQP